MRRTGWLVIVAFVAVPALMFAILWGCWSGGVFDTVPEAGKIQIAALFRTGDAVECDLSPLHPGHDLVRTELLPPAEVKGTPITVRVRVWQRPIVFGKRPAKRVQLKVVLPAADARVALVLTDGSDSIIWPPPKMK